MYINKTSIKTSKQVLEHGSKNKSVKNHYKKYYIEILRGALTLSIYDFFQLFLSEKVCFIQIYTHKSINIILIQRDLQKGETKRFITEKPRSTPEVDGGMSNANLNPSCPNPKQREKIKSNFYFNTAFKNALGVNH